MELELDFATVLAPLEGETRGGRDLREDDDPNNAYRRIRDARNEARDEERQADLNGESAPGAMRLWAQVWDEGVDYLSSVAKDLEIVAYMVEASVRLGGFGGLSQSLKLTKSLIEEFWGELLPTPDEDGIETTIRPISRLNGDVITYPLMRVPITADTSAGQFVGWQYAQARQLQTLSPEEQQERISRGATTMELLSRSVAETAAGDPRFFVRLLDSLQQARTSVTELQDAFEQRVDDEFVPNFSKFTGSLDEVEVVIRQLAGDLLAVDDESEDDAEGAGGEGSGGEGGSAKRKREAGELASREDAFRMLEQAARWFEQNEPQSFLPFEIRNAIRRGRMNPAELYADLIRDEEVRRQLFRDVGIHLSEESSDGESSY